MKAIFGGKTLSHHNLILIDMQLKGCDERPMTYIPITNEGMQAESWKCTNVIPREIGVGGRVEV
jgi:hypothetical protein